MLFVLIYEIILVNDASIDNTKAVINNLQLKYDFIHIINLTKNIGQVGATLVGMGVGDIAFIDNAVEAFQWVYDNSRPGANPLNIRVTSNSWGSSL